ncbi:hypothetical protein [Christensenella timonensis]|uniref:hypothetical protein n=1 Tax=Christensenella timonensis TaxID=1816678 RepID=UPI0008360DB1|nr:hypothetical protein [Christensenella timonensis]
MAMSSYGYPYGAPFYFAGGLIAFYIILVAVFYVFSALGLYTMAKRRGLNNPWLAWIPVVYIYVIGKLADTYAAKHLNKRTNYAVLLLGLIVGVVVLAIIMMATLFAGMLHSYSSSHIYAFLPAYIIFVVLLIAIAIVYAVFYYISLYRIYNWHSESATVLLVLSILFSVIVPFVLFALRNGDNRYLYPPQQPGGGQPYAQQPYPQQPGPGYPQPPQQYYAPPQAPPVQQAPATQPQPPTQPPQQQNPGGNGNAQ